MDIPIEIHASPAALLMVALLAAFIAAAASVLILVAFKAMCPNWSSNRRTEQRRRAYLAQRNARKARR